MTVRKDEEVQDMEADPHLFRIFNKKPRQSGIKEAFLSGSLDEE